MKLEKDSFNREGTSVLRDTDEYARVALEGLNFRVSAKPLSRLRTNLQLLRHVCVVYYIIVAYTPPNSN